ncbi:calcineurin-like phosphoesterase family protein [Limibacter armeniacum]|uniref:calcineurin-like phosphoesterase family protein n=1 Tax=Limibacter armeniacum TaxID=466084 RepID=UPI002FE653FE
MIKNIHTNFILTVIAWLLIFNFQTANGKTIYLKGKVYNDLNRNGFYDKEEKGVAGVSVSNGTEVVVTDSNGDYKIPVSAYQTVFVIKPSGYQLPMDEFGISKGYYHYYPEGTPPMDGPGIAPTGKLPKQLDFGLYKVEEKTTFKIALWGDTQAGGEVDWNHINKLVAEEIIKDGGVDFSVLLGDITHDNVNIFSAAKQTLKICKMPMHVVPGNHDRDYDVLATDPALDMTSFKNAFGPSHYAFNYGKVHFIVLNDIVTVTSDLITTNTHGDYEEKLSKEQLDFVKNDLAFVPKDRLVVFCQHAPLADISNYQELQQLLADRQNLLAISGHNHWLHQEYLSVSEDNVMHEIIAGATCGSIWTGALDWEGIPLSVMSDGVPKGYAYLMVDGTDYKLQYKASKMPVDKQMQIWIYEKNKWDWGMSVPENLTERSIVANVFTGSDSTMVTMRIDEGEWQPMDKKLIPDPYLIRWRYLESKGVGVSDMTNTLNFSPVQENPHIWVGSYPETLSTGVHKVEIKTQDPIFGNFYDVRVFRVNGSGE